MFSFSVQSLWHGRRVALLLLAGCMALMGIVSAPAAHTSAATVPFRVYFSFEDGPSDAYTPELLDILARYGAKASFTVLGSAIKGHEALLRQIVLAGHTIVIHGWDEKGSYAGTPAPQLIAAYQRTENAIITALGTDAYRYEAQPKMYWQPAGGAQPLLIPDRQITTYTWNANSNDCFGFAKDGDVSGIDLDQLVYDSVLNRSGTMGVWDVFDYGDGVIVAMHNVNRVTTRVLPRILDVLVKAGATFESLPRPADAPNTMPVRIGVPPVEGAGLPGVQLSALVRAAARMRTAPAQQYNITGVVPFGTQVMVIARHDNWMKIQFNGETGWVSRALLDVNGPIPSLPDESGE